MRAWHEEVASIANLFTDNWDDELLRGNFCDLILQLTVEQPLKIPFLAAVVLVANTNRPEVVDTLLVKLVSNVETMIGMGEWRDVKLYLKLLACLQSCLEGEGVFPLLEDLFSRAVDLQTASSDDVSSLFIVYRRKEAVSVLTSYATDHRNGAGQDYPAHAAVCHGGFAWPVGAEGSRAHGEDRGHRHGAARSSDADRTISCRDRRGVVEPVDELAQAAAKPTAARGDQRMGAIFPAETKGDPAR